jgi:hypothetical protein
MAKKWKGESLVQPDNGLQRVNTLTLSFIYWAGVEPSPLLLRSLIGLLYEPWIIGDDDCGAISGINTRQWKPKYSKKTCPSATLFTAKYLTQAQTRPTVVRNR